MENALFDAVRAEKDPMFDCAVITAQGPEYLKLPYGNDHNNCHSATKFFVAAMIGMLCDEGKMSVTDKVTSFFTPDMLPKNMDKRWYDVTVAQTMQHKTGIEKIPYGVDNDSAYEALRQEYGESFLPYVFSLPIIHEPGTVYHYSDATYHLLCHIIGRVSGMNAEEYLRQKIANPLHWAQWGMNKAPDGTPVGGDGLFSNALDMAKFAWTCAVGGTWEGHQYLSSSYLQAMRDNDYASTHFRDTDIWLKTGANGQAICYSYKRPAAACWHGYNENDPAARNDRLFLGFEAFLDQRFGKL